MPSVLRRSALLVSLFCLAVTGLVVPAVGTAQAALPSGTSAFSAVARLRVADTRAGHQTGFTRINSTTVRVPLGTKVPAGTTTVVLNVTAFNSAGFGGVTVYPAGTVLPGTAHVVLTAKGQTRTAMVHVRLGTSKSVDIKSTVGAGLIVELVGAYTAMGSATSARAGRFAALPGPRRALTNVNIGPGNSTVTDLSLVGVPAGASAAVLVLSSEAGNPGAWLAYADGTTRPAGIDLWLDAKGQRRSNQTIVRLKPGQTRVRVFSQAGGRITVDVVGFYTGATAASTSSGLFLPPTSATPYRRVDTRKMSTLAPMGPTVVEFQPGTPQVVQGVVGTARLLGSWNAGTAVTRPSGVSGQPAMPVARLTVPRDNISMPFYARTSSRGVAVTLNSGSHLIVDVAGWFIGERPTAVLAPTKVNLVTSTNVTHLRWRDAAGTHVKQIDVSSANDSVTTTLVANRGNVVGYKGLSTLGRPGNTMLFAHRTSAGGPFRYINTIPVGATFSIRGVNGKWHNYKVVNRQVTSPFYSRISGIASLFPPITAQLVACSKPDGTPTSTSYRLVVTGILVSITNS